MLLLCVVVPPCLEECQYLESAYYFELVVADGQK